MQFNNNFENDREDNYYDYNYNSSNNNSLVPTVIEEKPKRRRGLYVKKSTALLIAGCMLLSGAMGFGGGILSNKIFNNSSSSSSGLTVSTSTSTATPVSTTTAAESGIVAAVADAVGNSVVEITTEVVTTGSFMKQYISEGAGSGVIISKDGYIMTNKHVISGANKITVTLKDSKTYDAKLVGYDTEIDVALIKIDANDLTPVTFGDSSKLQVGELAIAIGNPLGQLGGTVTDGIISALNRDITIDGETMNLLQTNAAINPGNSGGGLFNSNGELVGLVVAKSSGSDVEGLGFAIPSNDVKDVVEQISKYGYVKGRVDVQMSFVDVNTPQLAMMYRVSKTGLYVSKVESGSNAEKAGFKSGDCILSVDGKEVSSSTELSKILDSHSVGDTLSVKVLRDGMNVDIKWTLAEYVPSTSLSSSTQQSGSSSSSSSILRDILGSFGF